MKKTLIALAVVAALPVAAQADSSNVTVYGLGSMAFDNVSATGAGSAADSMNKPARNRVSSYASRIGFKGTEDLGNGMAANFQIEQEIAMDSASGGAFGGSNLRNTYVGLSGKSWGEVRLGAHDTPFKLSTAALDPFADTAGDYNSIIGSIGNTTMGGAGTGASSTFELRASNALAYITPDFSGFHAAIAYVANETKGATPTPAGNANKDPRAWSMAGIYKNGPIYAALGWERHYDLGYMLTNAATYNETETGTRLGLGYSFGDTNVGLVYEKLKADNGNTAAAVNKYERNAWTINVAHKLGANTIKAAYAKANDGTCGKGNGSACSTAGLGAKQWTLGVDHAMSKRTTVYALYTSITNNYDTTAAQGGTYDFGVNGLTPSAGADPKGLSLGMKHSF